MKTQIILARPIACLAVALSVSTGPFLFGQGKIGATTEDPRTEAIGADLKTDKLRLKAIPEKGTPKDFTMQLNGEKLQFKAIPGKEDQGWLEAPIPSKLLSSLKKAAPALGPLAFKGRELVREPAGANKLFADNNLDVDITGAAQDVLPETIDEDRSLLIRDLAIVNDARASGLGPWSFGGVMTKIATQSGVADAPKMVGDWLKLWASDQTVPGGDVVKARKEINTVMASWPKSPGGKLDLAQSPFRLTAIVNRLDLRPKPTPETEGEGGEGRFVYCLIDPVTKEPFRGGEAFLIIFEFGIKFNSRKDVADYGQEWVALSQIEFEQPEFKTRLEQITNKFTVLNQLRTNERLLVAATGGNWELREFRIKNDSKGFFPDTVKRTPANRYASFMGATPAHLSALKQWAKDHEPAILADDPPIEGTLMVNGKTEPFVGAAAETRSPTSFWDIPDGGVPLGALRNDVDHHLSLQTCNGCHGGEAHVSGSRANFVHIKERGANERAILSEFLDGMEMKDPRVSTETRRHNDLARRVKDLSDLLSVLSDNPLPELRRNPLKFVH